MPLTLKVTRKNQGNIFGIVWVKTGYCNGIVNPQIDGKVNHHQIDRDLLFHLFGDDYIYICYITQTE